MGEFDDLFDRGIPREAVHDFFGELQKLAVSMGWVHRAVTKGSKGAPVERLLETASRNARGANQAARTGNADLVKKRLLVKNKALDEALHRGGQSKAAADKQAVSTEWVANAARNASHTVSRGRLNEVASKSMKGVLNAAKGKGPMRQAHIDKRQALRSSVLGGQATRIDTVRPPAFAKAAGDSKAALVSKIKSHLASSKANRIAGIGADKLRETARKNYPSAPNAGLFAMPSKMAAAADKTRAELTEPSAEQVMLAEQKGLLQQTAQENLALRSELEQSQGLIQEHATAAEEAGMMAQQTQEDLQMAQTQAQETQMQAEQAMAEAQEAAAMAQQEAQMQAAEAAAQADGKMRLSIRIQQMRQQLADMASQDPVTEEGEQAQPIMTAGQQGMGDPAMDPNADPAMAGQDPAAAAAGAPADPAAAAAPAGPPAGGEAAPAAKPKAKPKPKKEESKSESKAPKTEIKIGMLLEHARAKLATEEHVRSDARRAAGRAGMIQGSAAGTAVGHLAKKNRLVGALAGAVLGRELGQASFNKRELANDLHMERALTKSRRDRHDKEQEKKAVYELSDHEIDAMFGL